MSSILKHPVRSLPCVGEPPRQTDVPIRVTHMTWRHANVWQALVQPLINRHFRHWRHGMPDAHARADVGWNWHTILGLAVVYNASAAVLSKRSSPALAMAVVISTHQGKEFPIGLLTVVPKFLCNLSGRRAQSSFTWYLAYAPRVLYSERYGLGRAPIKGVATTLLDCAIQCGLEAGLPGDMLLHADPHGGLKLRKFYEERCGMQPIDPDNGPISLLRRRHTDEYLQMSAAQAAQFCRKLDPRR